MQRLRAAEHRRQRLQRDAHDVVVRLLRRERAAGRLRMEAKLLRPRIGRMKTVFHDPRPQPPGRAELRDFLEKIVVGVEEEREPLAELIDVEPRVDRRLHVRDGVCEGERHFLYGGRTGLADVITADRDRVPVRQLAFAERENVGHDPKRRTRRIDVRAARDVLLQDVVLDRARKSRQPDALSLGDGDVQRKKDDGGRVDRHRRGDAVERNPIEQRRHVLDRVDRDADASHFTGGERMIGVVSHLRRQIECDAQAGDAIREQVPISLVRFLGGRKAGVLPHRPEPPAVHGRLDPARKRVPAGLSEGGRGIPSDKICGRASVVRHQGGL